MLKTIVAQYKGLKANKVHPSEIRSVLDGDTKTKVLLLIDGHDEYNGCNNDIDEPIRKKQLWNCWIILTSRQTEDIKKLKENMDA